MYFPQHRQNQCFGVTEILKQRLTLSSAAGYESRMKILNFRIKNAILNIAGFIIPPLSTNGEMLSSIRIDVRGMEMWLSG